MPGILIPRVLSSPTRRIPIRRRRQRRGVITLTYLHIIDASRMRASERATAREYRRDQSRRYDSSARVNALYSLTIISRLLYDRGQDVTSIKHLTRHLVGLTEVEVLKKVKGFIVSLDIIWNDGNSNFVRFDQRNG